MTNNVIKLAPQQIKFLQYELNSNSRGSQNAGIAFEIKGPIDFNRLDQALAILVKKHDAFLMNLTYDNTNNLVHQMNDFTIQWIKHQNIENAHQAMDEARNEVLKPMDLFNQPLFEFHQYLLSNDHAFLLIKASHIIVDGPSFTAIYMQLTSLYENLESDIKTFSFKEFINLETQYASSPMGKKSIAYWQEQQRSISSIITVEDIKNIQLIEALNPSNKLDLGIIKKVARKHKTSIFNIVLFLYSKALANLFKSNDFIVGYTLTNRFQDEMRYMVGLTTHCVRLSLQDINHTTIHELMDDVKKQVTQNFTHFIVAESIEIPSFTLSYLSETIKLPDFKGLEVIKHPFNSNLKYNDSNFTLLCNERVDYIELSINCDNDIFSNQFNQNLYTQMQVEMNNMFNQE